MPNLPLWLWAVLVVVAYLVWTRVLKGPGVMAGIQVARDQFGTPYKPPGAH